MGPKTENVEISLVLPLLFEGSRVPGVFQENEQHCEKSRLGGGRGRINPPPRSLVWRFREVWRVWYWFEASTRLEAQGLGGLDCRCSADAGSEIFDFHKHRMFVGCLFDDR